MISQTTKFPDCRLTIFFSNGLFDKAFNFGRNSTFINALSLVPVRGKYGVLIVLVCLLKGIWAAECESETAKQTKIIVANSSWISQILQQHVYHTPHRQTFRIGKTKWFYLWATNSGKNTCSCKLTVAMGTMSESGRIHTQNRNTCIRQTPKQLLLKAIKSSTGRRV